MKPNAKTNLVILFAAFLYVASMTTSEAQTKGCDTACIEEKVYHHLELMGQFDQVRALDVSIAELQELGPPAARVVEDVYEDLTGAARAANSEDRAELNVMRWRVVNLMGYLGRPEHVLTLYDIARKALPDPRADENLYAQEYRIRQRAVVSLEILKAVEYLKLLHELEGPLKNATATSLYVLGVEMPKMSMVDARKALEEDQADSTDHNPNEGRKPQPQKPGSEKYRVEPRPDTPKTDK